MKPEKYQHSQKWRGKIVFECVSINSERFKKGEVLYFMLQCADNVLESSKCVLEDFMADIYGFP